MKEEQGDLFGTGAQRRDAGIEQVVGHNLTWFDMCIEEAESFVLCHKIFTGEDIRFHCREEVGEPRHPNAWGGLISALVKRKVIAPIGKHRAMRDPISHARQTPLYRAY